MPRVFDVFTIGGATRDIFIHSPLFKVVHDPEHLNRLGFPAGEAQCFALGAKIEVDRPVESLGGGAVNAAVTFARQGFRTATVGIVGNDAAADRVDADLKHERITSFVRRRKQAGTAYSVILISPDGERTILNYRGASQDMTLRDVPLSSIRARWAYISTGKVPFIVMKSIVARLARAGTRIAMNPSRAYIEQGLSRLAPMLKKLDIVIMNREEAALLTGVPYEHEQGIFRALDDVVPGIAVMTDGAKGVMVSDGTTIYRAGIFPERAVRDRTGAGDAFGSGFTAGIMRDVSIPDAIRLGSANATSVVEAVGATPGILKKSEFMRMRRWANLPVRTHART